MIPIVWYIHGAHASPRSFTYLKSVLPEHDFIDISYSCDTPMATTMTALVAQARSSPRPIHIISHSLGGVAAIALSQRVDTVRRIATISSPFGGSKVAGFMRWMVSSQLFNDIHPYSPLITQITRNPVTVPVLSIVTTGGHSSLMSEPNDGVVTVESQMAIKGPIYLPMNINHSEILMADETVSAIKPFIFGA